ncbi:PREDICTED: probable vacuolar amino acid transporter YPQ2 [Tarenaya hassleriana]|uniref:probable vacuolar amino acid transporter YPQ2 n=1 Tax=Tarenaya hassleriana TaxID=28532 RepID=UPI00053C35DE|nr:PREDICTED: probable vacuolar amino acid transporter YPQ2 [Tarenaya hassleriana]
MTLLTSFFFGGIQIVGRNWNAAVCILMLSSSKKRPFGFGNRDGSSSEEDDVDTTINTIIITTESTFQPRPVPSPACVPNPFFISIGHRFDECVHGQTSTTSRLISVYAQCVVGQWLGWSMAAIYMGGRVPQIWLNTKRGSVWGLNPLMFAFALLANLTQVASILARTTKWDTIKANLPWLLDAVVCVALDLLIILQYIYYSSFMNKNHTHEEDNYGDNADATKGFVS